MSSAVPFSPSHANELRLLEQAHLALGLSTRLEEFCIILASLIVDPHAFDFSRSFILRYDASTQTYEGKVALGGRTREQHERLRHDILRETGKLREQTEQVAQLSPEHTAVQPLYNLRFHSLWINLLQERETTETLDTAFHTIRIKRDELTDDHIISRAAKSSSAAIYEEGQVTLGSLERFVSLPLIAGRLVTKAGVHSIVLADRAFEDRALDAEAVYHFQWILNHASTSLENVELVEQLTETTRRVQELDKLKSSFLSIVSHELRTPLTSIIGFLHLLLDDKTGALAPAQKDLLRRITVHSSHLQSMVNDLLEIAEVESGGMINTQMDRVDPLEVLMATLPKIEGRRSSRRVTIQPVITDPIPCIRTDRNALERIYFHLLDNAVKFIANEGIVRVEFRRSDGNLNISIVDNGIGISQSELKRIFDQFYQVDSRLERSYGGLGIGLTVVKLLLDATGGKLNVESKVGEGSRFIVTFPVFDECNGGE